MPISQITTNSIAGNTVTSGILATSQTLSVNGITFPATQSASTDANTLDDYEEGTFTPGILGSSSNPTVSGTTFGSYVKIGRLVSCHLQWQISSYTGGSGTILFNLPFVCVTGYGHGHSGCIGPFYATTFPNSGNYPLYNCRVEAGASQLALWFSSNGGGDGQWSFSNSTLGNFGGMSIVYDTTA